MIGVMLSLRGNNNIPIFIPILLNKMKNSDGSIVNKIMSIYKRSAMMSTTSKWLENVLGEVNGKPTNLLYINKKD